MAISTHRHQKFLLGMVFTGGSYKLTFSGFIVPMRISFIDFSIGGSGPNEVISLLNYSTFSKAFRKNTVNSFTLYCGQITCWLSTKSPTYFLPDHVVRNREFPRVDLKFLREEHSFSICDMRFGCIQQFFDTKEKN